MLKRFLIAMLMVCVGVAGYAQGKLSIANVRAAFLRNSGVIMEDNQAKGYFSLYQTDRIDRRTNEYTLQILDQNVNKVIDIKFEDTKKLSLLEAAYNTSSLAFLFKNSDNRTLDLKIYDTEGKLKYTYSRSYESKTDRLMKKCIAADVDARTNQQIFNLGQKGYASVFPICNGKRTYYGVDFYSSETKDIHTYVPAEEEGTTSKASYLGSYDSLIIIQVLKKNRKAEKEIEPHVVAINFITGKKAFEINTKDEDHIFLASRMIDLKVNGKILLMGNYYAKGDKVSEGKSRGIAAYEINSNGELISTHYNSWANDLASYIPASTAYLHIQSLIQSNSKLFIIGESFNRPVMMELNSEYRITNATAFNKSDYKFAATDAYNTDFTVCYSDRVKSDAYKGQTFNSVRFNGEKFVTDRMKLRTKASKMLVLPAKMGSVMIVEYFRKTKKLELRLEKMG